MANNVIMKSKDTLAAALAECYATLDGNRYNCMNMIKAEFDFKKKKTEVPILGKPGRGNKATGWAGTWSATCHYNSSIMRKLAERYKNDGQDFYFEIQVVNNDPSSDAGEQIMTFKECNMDELILAKFDADGEYLDEDMSGTFDDFSVDKGFEDLAGMLV